MSSTKTALITGGSGLVGSYLSQFLLKNGWVVKHMSTRKNHQPSLGIVSFIWNPSKGYFDQKALEGVEVVFHLAGASVSNRWTPAYKDQILSSRILSTRCLSDALQFEPNQVKALISASAVGIYPSSEKEIFSENAKPASDFLGTVSQEWEKEVLQLENLNAIRTASLRIGIVLSRSGGVLAQLEPIFKFGLGSALGNGKQFMSWIHIHDLAAAFLHVYEKGLSGPVNAGGPKPVTNSEFSRILAKTMRKPYFLPPVPEMVLKLALGEMATLALMSQNVNDKKLRDSGFNWTYPNLEAALFQLYKKPN